METSKKCWVRNSSDGAQALCVERVLLANKRLQLIVKPSNARFPRWWLWQSQLTIVSVHFLFLKMILDDFSWAHSLPEWRWHFPAPFWWQVWPGALLDRIYVICAVSNPALPFSSLPWANYGSGQLSWGYADTGNTPEQHYAKGEGAWVSDFNGTELWYQLGYLCGGGK